MSDFNLNQLSLLWKFELNWMAGYWEKFLWWWMVVAQQNRVTQSPFDFWLLTWTWIVTKCSVLHLGFISGVDPRLELTNLIKVCGWYGLHLMMDVTYLWKSYQLNMNQSSEQTQHILTLCLWSICLNNFRNWFFPVWNQTTDQQCAW